MSIDGAKELVNRNVLTLDKTTLESQANTNYKGCNVYMQIQQRSTADKNTNKEILEIKENNNLKIYPYLWITFNGITVFFRTS